MEKHKGIRNGAIVLGLAGLLTAAPLSAQGLNDLLRGLGKVNRTLRELNHIKRNLNELGSQPSQNQSHYFACNYINRWEFPFGFRGIKSTFRPGEPLQLVDYDPYSNAGDIDDFLLYGPGGNLILQEPHLITANGEDWTVGLNTFALAQNIGLGGYRGIFTSNHQEMGEVDFYLQ